MTRISRNASWQLCCRSRSRIASACLGALCFLGVFCLARSAGAWEPREVPGSPADTVTIVLASASAAPGELTTIEVTLGSPAELAVGVQNDIVFPPGLRVVSCAVNPGIRKESTVFSLTPVGCTPGVSCQSVTALVLSIRDTSAIADGALIYSCMAQTASTVAPGTVLRLTCLNPDASTARGEPLPAACSDGSVQVVARRCPGDCDGDGSVSIDELVTGVGIALGDHSVGICPAFDRNMNGLVTIDEIVAATRRALSGC